jgi:hypothetical protein
LIKQRKLLLWTIIICLSAFGFLLFSKSKDNFFSFSGTKFDSGPPPPSGNQFDVIVVGGEPEGVAAAVSASRNGLTVLLVEEGPALGGLMTLGGLNFIDMNLDNQRRLLTRGIFQEFYQAVGGTSFDITEAKNVFKRMVTDQRSIILKLNTRVVEPVMDGNTLVGIVVEEDGQIAAYFGHRLIDATVDADLAAAAGAPYTFAGEDFGLINHQMGVTLVFEVAEVSWLKVFARLNLNRIAGLMHGDERKREGATRTVGWGYLEEGYAYAPTDPLMRLRGLNIARQKNGNVLINALIIFGVDVLDRESKQQAIERAKAELEQVIPYFQENLPGFERAKLAGVSERLYVRESRHILGEYVLTINDVLENRDHWDRIALGSYPVDIQPSVNQRMGVVLGDPDRYSIPFRSLVPLEVENLLVVGRSASYTSLAAASARVIPIGMAAGEAAGVAAAYSIGNSSSFREMTRSAAAVKAIQERLLAQGAFLEEFTLPYPGEGHWAIEGIRFIRSLGLLAGGYDNVYRFDEPMSGLEFQNLFNNAMDRSFAGEASPLPYIYIGEAGTIDQNAVAAAFLSFAQAIGPSVSRDTYHQLAGASANAGSGSGVEAEGTPLQLAVAKGHLTAETARRASQDDPLTKAAVYQMIADFVQNFN